jgi:hypothetical protein
MGTRGYSIQCLNKNFAPPRELPDSGCADEKQAPPNKRVCMLQKCPNEVKVGTTYAWLPSGDVGDCDASCLPVGKRTIDPGYPTAPLLYRCLRTTTSETSSYGISSKVSQVVSTETKRAWLTEQCDEGPDGEDSDCFSDPKNTKCGPPPAAERVACNDLEECPRNEFEWHLTPWSQCEEREPCPNDRQPTDDDAWGVQHRKAILVHRLMKGIEFVSEKGLSGPAVTRTRAEHGDKVPAEPDVTKTLKCFLGYCPPVEVQCKDIFNKITCCAKCSWVANHRGENFCVDRLPKEDSLAEQCPRHNKKRIEKDAVIGHAWCSADRISCYSGDGVPKIIGRKSFTEHRCKRPNHAVWFCPYASKGCYGTCNCGSTSQTSMTYHGTNRCWVPSYEGFP